MNSKRIHVHTRVYVLHTTVIHDRGVYGRSITISSPNIYIIHRSLLCFKRHSRQCCKMSNSSSQAAGAPRPPPTSPEWTYIAPVDSLGPRTPLKINDRNITLFHIRHQTPLASPTSHWTCIDSTCYHAGGPLTKGPLRRVAGRTCLECPWHKYLIDVYSGEGLYMDLDRRYCSKGVRQRVHEVRVWEGGVWVKVVGGGSSKEDGGIASDDYAFQQWKGTAPEW